jgi:hypothetical protein
MFDQCQSSAALARLGFFAVVLAGMGAIRRSRADPAATNFRDVAADGAAVFTHHSGEEAGQPLIGINAFPPARDWPPPTISSCSTALANRLSSV